MAAGPLGRLPATDDEHIVKYSLTPQTLPTTPTPVVLGVNWYTNFDDPVRKRRNGRWEYWIGLDRYLGDIRGGHAVCLKPDGLDDDPRWWAFYDQGVEGACVGFAISRAGSLLNRKRYNGFAIYQRAQEVDEWPGEDYDGTSVRAGCDVWRKEGLYRQRGKKYTGPHHADAIVENRWARSVEQVAQCLSPGDGGRVVMDCGYVTILNSWGRHGYPHYTFLPLETLHRLIMESGEATLVTDK